MNYTRLLLAAVAGFVAYMAVGGVFFVVPALRAEFEKYPAIYRSGGAGGRVMGVGMLGLLLAMGALAVLFAMIHPGGAGWIAGLHLGCVAGVFVLGVYVLHNYMTLQIGGRIVAMQGVVHFIQWVLVGAVIALVYRP